MLLVRMLQFFLQWKTYRTFKSGLLIDYYFKRIFFYISSYFFFIFTVFFWDKYILELTFSLIYRVLYIVGAKVQALRKLSFLSLFKFTLYILLYIGLLVALIIF